LIDRISKILPGLFFIIIGLIYAFRNTYFSELVIHNAIFITLIVFGWLGVLVNIGQNKRVVLFISVFIFMSGIYYFVIENFELLNKSTFPFPVLSIISGIAIFLLFFDNPQEKKLLFISIALLLIGFIALSYNYFWFNRYANNLSNIIYGYWPVFLVFIGINLLLSRERY